MSTYLQLTADEEGVIYAVNGLGELDYYRDKTHDGTSGFNSWTDSSPRKIGVGWDTLIKVVAGGDGIDYAVNDGGDLRVTATSPATAAKTGPTATIGQGTR
jgi:hypothetical protein